MTFLEALLVMRPDSGRPEDAHRPIRRACWVAGHRLQWIPRSSRWAFGNRYAPDLAKLDILDDHRLDLTSSQGVLTPSTMLADDWEVIG